MTVIGMTHSLDIISLRDIVQRKTLIFECRHNTEIIRRMAQSSGMTKFVYYYTRQIIEFMHLQDGSGMIICPKLNLVQLQI